MNLFFEKNKVICAKNTKESKNLLAHPQIPQHYWESMESGVLSELQN